MSFPVNPNAVWAADGKFSMPTEIARLVPWLAAGGQTGIVGPESLRVTPAPTPGSSVRIRPGVFVIAATPEHQTIQTGYTSAPWQSYMRALFQTQTVTINSTGTSGPRIDVVGIEIVDPTIENTAEGMSDAAWLDHQFWRVRVIEGANQGQSRPHHFASLARPFLPLARINIPANTGTITQAMITDLRFMAVEREKTVEFMEPANTGSSNLTLGQSQTDWYSFPEILGITVPQWATHVTLKGTLTSFRVAGSGTASGAARLQFTADTGWQSTQETSIREDGSFLQSNLHVGGRFSLDYDARNTGRDGRVRLQVRRSGGAASLQVPPHSVTTSWVEGRVIFEEAPRGSIGG